MLSYKTRGGSRPDGKPYIFFTACPEDFAAYFERLANELLGYIDAAIWFRSEPAEAWSDDFREDLNRMSLVVIPVTKRLLTEEWDSVAQTVAYAQEHHIRVLPLQQEAGIEDLSNEKFGNFQMLYEGSKDATALSYEEKLNKYFAEFINGFGIQEKLDQTQHTHIFLSYRKRDRAYVNELIRTIHNDRRLQDIGIWYDEYLVPGEDFSDNIAAQLESSDIVVLLLTDNTLEPDNYVLRVEYPEACRMGKPILPVNAALGSESAAAARFADLPVCTPLDAPDRLCDRLAEMVAALPGNRKDDTPEHKYIVGVAYWMGIGMERNGNLGVQMVCEAAEDGFAEASLFLFNWLKDMSAQEEEARAQAIYWGEKYAGQIGREYAQNETLRGPYLDAVYQMALFYSYLKDYENSSVWRERLLALCREKNDDDSVLFTSIVRELNGDQAFAQDDKTLAAAEYEASGEYQMNYAGRFPDAPKPFLQAARMFIKAAGVYSEIAETEAMARCAGRAHEILEAHAAEDPSGVTTSIEADCFMTLGGAAEQWEQYDEALDFYHEALARYDEAYAVEQHSFDHTNYPLACLRIAKTLLRLDRDAEAAESIQKGFDFTSLLISDGERPLQSPAFRQALTAGARVYINLAAQGSADMAECCGFFETFFQNCSEDGLDVCAAVSDAVSDAGAAILYNRDEERVDSALAALTTGFTLPERWAESDDEETSVRAMLAMASSAGTAGDAFDAIGAKEQAEGLDMFRFKTLCQAYEMHSEGEQRNQVCMSMISVCRALAYSANRKQDYDSVDEYVTIGLKAVAEAPALHDESHRDRERLLNDCIYLYKLGAYANYQNQNYSTATAYYKQIIYIVERIMDPDQASDPNNQGILAEAKNNYAALTASDSREEADEAEEPKKRRSLFKKRR